MTVSLSLFESHALSPARTLAFDPVRNSPNASHTSPTPAGRARLQGGSDNTVTDRTRGSARAENSKRVDPSELGFGWGVLKIWDVVDQRRRGSRMPEKERRRTWKDVEVVNRDSDFVSFLKEAGA